MLYLTNAGPRAVSSNNSEKSEKDSTHILSVNHCSEPVSFSPSPVTGGAKPAMFIISQSKVSHPVWHPLCLFTGKTPTIQNTLSLSLSLWIESLFSPSLLSRAKLSPSINLRVLNSEMNRVMCIFYFNFIYILIQKKLFQGLRLPFGKMKNVFNVR